MDFMQDISFNEMELSAIGEISNISLGNAATSLGILLHNNVEISTPRIEIKNKGEIVQMHKENAVIIRVNYIKGIQGYSILFLKEEDVKIITDLMMGSDGYGMFYEQELSELHISAVSEAMNQMMGSAATAMSTMMDRVVDISIPETAHMSAGEYVAYEFPNDDRFLQINFRVKLGDVVVTDMVQMYPYVLGKAIADLFILNRDDILQKHNAQ